MLPLYFNKYQATGNDFVLLDDRGSGETPLSNDQVRWLCDRHFGVGGDGLIQLLPDPELDMEMRFYNPDASMSFCGNGSRCAVQAFFAMENEGGDVRFRAIDGVHEGELWADGRVSVSIGDVEKVEERKGHFFVDTGSPHVIRVFDDDIDEGELEEEALFFKRDPLYVDEGVNVNLVRLLEEGHVAIRTHERGVEAETLSCGSGVTAAALWAAHLGKAGDRCRVSTRGGDLEVRFHHTVSTFRDIRLIGPAEKVFSGEIG